MMTKKIYFLLAFLLLIGGGKLWAATDVIVLDPFTSSEVSANAFSREGSLFTVSVTGCNYLNTSKFQLGDGTQFVITPSNSNVKVLSIGFTNVGTGSNDKATCTVNGNSITGNTFLNDKGADNNPKTCTWDNNTDATSFTILFGKIEGNPYAVITSITITYQVMYRGSMPYTWDFDSWPLTTSSMMTANENAKWTTSSSDYLYQLTPSGAALVDGNNDPISETSGLTFTASTAGDIWTDLNTGVGLKSNASVTIPAKTGQKIAVHAWWPAEEMRLMNAEYTSGVNTFIPSSGDGTYEFTATADNVTLQANTSNLYIYSIAVTKNDLTTYVVSNDDNYYYGGTSGSAYFNPNTTFTYNPAYTGGHYIRTRVNMNINTTSLTAADFEITSSDETVLDPTGFGKADARETGTSGIYKFIFNGIEAKKPGTATLTIKYKGSDVYNEITCQETFTFAKATPTIAFAETGNQTKNYSTSTYTNVASESTTYGRTITYSSSDTHVATVADGGVVTFVNSGKTVITATAEGDNYYNTATASYTLTVNGTQTPVIAWKSQTGLSESGGVYTADNLPYGNSKAYTAQVTDADGSGVGNSAIRYGVVETYAGYLTVDDTKGTITPTRKFVDDNNGADTQVQVYAYIPGSGTRNPSERIVYNVTITKGMLAETLFAQTELTVNAGCIIAPKNNVQSMRFADITAITVSVKTGSTATGVAGNTGTMISDYIVEANNGHKSDYFETAVKNDVEQLANFFPIFKGLSAGDVTFTVTVQSKVYGDLSGDFTLHVIESSADTPLSWASGVKTGHGENDGYTIYVGDYMLIPSITGNCNGNFDYSDGYKNANTYHKYLYTRRWAGSAYEFIYNNRNYKKGQGVPNYELCSDAAGTTVVDPTTAGNEVALLFWNVGGSNDTDELLIYGNKAGTIYLRAKDSQVDRQLETIKITVKSRSTIDSDFDAVTSAMTFPYTWDFTAESFAGPTDSNNGYWIDNGSGSYSLDMQSCFNYDYADYDKDGITWSNTGAANTSSSELTNKPLVSSFGSDKVMRGFSGMQIRLGNSGVGSWYSKRDGIHILPYNSNSSNTPRLQVATGTHTFVLPTPTGENCPETFKVFVKAKARSTGEGTIWVRNADLSNGDSGQNGYYNFKPVTAGEDVIYSVTATKGQNLELDLDKVEVYWVAYSTEEKTLNYPKTINYGGNDITTGVTYAANTYSYNEDLDIVKSDEANGVTAYYASSFTVNKDAAAGDDTQYAVTMTPANSLGYVKAKTGLLLKKAASGNAAQVVSCYMIANPRNVDTYSADEKIDGTTVKNYLVGTGNSSATVTGWDNGYTNFLMAYAYKYYLDLSNPNSAQGDYRFDRNWSFYPAMGSVTVPAQRSFLHIPQSLYVDKNGNIVEMPSGSRSHRSGDAAEAPATKAMLSIVFDDEHHGDDSGEITGINTVNERNIDSDAWYTLQGVRVNAPAKGGIYIHKGRKVVVK